MKIIDKGEQKEDADGVFHKVRHHPNEGSGEDEEKHREITRGSSFGTPLHQKISGDRRESTEKRDSNLDSQSEVAQEQNKEGLRDRRLKADPRTLDCQFEADFSLG